MTVRVLTGDCRETLAGLPDGSVQCVVTSPPYFGLRDYGHAGQIGLEPTPDAYVAELVAVFRAVWRVLRDDGTLWLNLGDSYASETKGSGGSGKSRLGPNGDLQNIGFQKMDPRSFACGVPSKNLIGIPWRVAFALQADGWYLRSDIIWSKPNPMPESVTDRPTKAHEYLFLLSKRERYYYDSAAIAEASESEGRIPGGGGKTDTSRNDGDRNVRPMCVSPVASTRNRRTVWTVATQPFSGAHFATFPPALIEPCILAGSAKQACETCGAAWLRVVERTPMVLDRSERTHEKGRTRTSGTMIEPPASTTLGFRPSCDCETNTGAGRSVVLDPFGGAGTTGLVADRLGRDAILCELNPQYADMARRRITDDNPLFGDVA
jgi:DNA modification methylase